MKKDKDEKPHYDKSLQQLLQSYLDAADTSSKNTPEQEKILQMIRDRDIPVRKVTRSGSSKTEHINTNNELDLNKKMQQGLSVIQYEYEALKDDMERGVDIIRSIDSWMISIDRRIRSLHYHFSWLEDISNINDKDNDNGTQIDGTRK